MPFASLAPPMLCNSLASIKRVNTLLNTPMASPCAVVWLMCQNKGCLRPRQRNMNAPLALQSALCCVDFFLISHLFFHSVWFNYLIILCVIPR